jgi:hypothetical protein
MVDKNIFKPSNIREAKKQVITTSEIVISVNSRTHVPIFLNPSEYSRSTPEIFYKSQRLEIHKSLFYAINTVLEYQLSLNLFSGPILIGTVIYTLSSAGLSICLTDKLC